MGTKSTQVFCAMIKAILAGVKKKRGSGRLTVCLEDQSCWRAVNFAFCDTVHHDAGVVAHIGGLHLGDVEVARLLGHETAVVLLDKVRVLVENPCIREVCRTKRGGGCYSR